MTRRTLKTINRSGLIARLDRVADTNQTLYEVWLYAGGVWSLVISTGAYARALGEFYGQT